MAVEVQELQIVPREPAEAAPAVPAQAPEAPPAGLAHELERTLALLRSRDLRLRAD
jgi:hypothetical protein